jgi:hypothetical protein
MMQSRSYGDGRDRPKPEDVSIGNGNATARERPVTSERFTCYTISRSNYGSGVIQPTINLGYP